MVRRDAIEAVGIDESGSVWVKPATATFPYIYREATEIRWRVERLRLYSPKPRVWSYVDWFKRIRDAAGEQGVKLTFEQTKLWSNVDDDLQRAIVASVADD